MAHDHRRNAQSNGQRRENGDASKSEQAFEVKIGAVYRTMQEDSDKIAGETNAYTGPIHDMLRQLEESQLRQRHSFRIMRDQADQNKEKFETLYSTYASLLDELVPCRMQEIKAGEEMTEEQSTQMRKSRKDMFDKAKRHLEEGREKLQLAADATELIKHYKAIMMAL